MAAWSASTAAAASHSTSWTSDAGAAGSRHGNRRPRRRSRYRRPRRLGASPPPVVSVQLVNNEVGTVQPLDAVAELVRARRRRRAAAHRRRAGRHVAGRGRATAEFDLVSLSAHKIGGPKGVGALVVRNGIALRPQLVGGGQERGLRSGTHNVAGIVGFGAAAAEAMATRTATVERVAALRRAPARRLRTVAPAGWHLTVPTGDGRVGRRPRPRRPPAARPRSSPAS